MCTYIVSGHTQYEPDEGYRLTHSPHSRWPLLRCPPPHTSFVPVPYPLLPSLHHHHHQPHTLPHLHSRNPLSYMTTINLHVRKSQSRE